MTRMRCKLRVSDVEDCKNEQGERYGQMLTFNAVAASSYPEDGSDENNTFAKWSPSATFTIDVRNPALFDGYEVGKEYYVDFTPVEDPAQEKADA